MNDCSQTMTLTFDRTLRPSWLLRVPSASDAWLRSKKFRGILAARKAAKDQATALEARFKEASDLKV